MKNKNPEPQEFALLAKIPKAEMTVLVEGYLDYVSKTKYLRFILFGIIGVIFGRTFFRSGEHITLEELKMIDTISVLVMVVLVIALLVIGAILFTKLRGLKKLLDHSAEKHQLDRKAVRKAFNLFVKTTLGGYGLR